MREPYNLGVTLEKVKQALSKKEPEKIAQITKSFWNAKNCTFTMPALASEVLINACSWEVTFKSGQKLDEISQILVLHYLNADFHVPLTGNLLAFKELPSAFIYQQAFYKRALEPLVNNFGKCPGLLITAGLKLGGNRADFKDESVILYPFPMVPITFVMHLGDEEFPASGNILFDSSVNAYFCIEDCTILASMLVRQLFKEGLTT